MNHVVASATNGALLFSSLMFHDLTLKNRGVLSPMSMYRSLSGFADDLHQVVNGPVPRDDGLAITWLDSTASMQQGAMIEAYAITHTDELNFLPDGHFPIITTRECVSAG